jgi:hypothetical protein
LEACEEIFYAMKRLDPTLALYFALLLTIAEVVLIVGTQSLTFGSGRGGWIYAYSADFQFAPLLAAIGLSLVIVALLHLSLRLINRYQTPILALWIVVGTVGQLLLHSLYPYSVQDIVRSDAANTYYNLSLKYGAYDLLSRYNAIAPLLPLHAKANMPGKILLYQGLELITSDPRTLGILIVAISSLGGLLVYFIVSAVYTSREVALSSLVLYLFIPARIYFLPLLNIISPLPMLACLLFLVWFIKSRRNLPAFLLGVGLYLALFFDPLPLFLGPFFVALLARSWFSSEVRVTDILRLLAFLLAGLFVVHLGLWFGLSFDAVSRLVSVMADASEFNRSQGRPYVVWVWADLLEFFLNVGVLSSLVCFAYLATGMVQSIRSLRARNFHPVSWLLQPEPLMFAALLVTLAVLDLCGFNRGEVVRLWIFLMVFVQVVVAGFCWEKAGRWTIDIVLAGSIIQTAMTISMIAFIR